MKRLKEKCFVQLPYRSQPLQSIKYGRLFGIDRNADLYRIDKKTGAQTKIGNTGVTIGAYYQSAAFDFKTNKLYWASASDSEENNVLYEVNVNTGQATEIKRISGQ